MHKLYGLALLCLVVLAPVPMAAQEQGPVERCVDSPGGNAEERPNRHACIGITLNECMDAPGGSSTMGMVDCFNVEIETWDNLLNQYYKQAQTDLPDSEKKALRDVQRMWIKFRDLSCEFAYNSAGGGSIRNPLAADCILQKTAEQALWIMQWADREN